MLTAQALRADEALGMGLVDDVVDDIDDGITQTIASFGPRHVVAVEMARRLLNESFAEEYEDAIGNFLAAQHRCVTQTEFLETLKRERRK
jgi:enoyl-CoA hydratase/carnithine racemase